MSALQPLKFSQDVINNAIYMFFLKILNKLTWMNINIPQFK